MESGTVAKGTLFAPLTPYTSPITPSRTASMHPRWLSLGILALLLLSACGFHLRGAVPLSPSMERVYIEGGSSVLARDLRLNLEASGAEVVDEPQAARSILRILGETIDRRVLTVGSDARVQEYELIHAVRFALVREDETTLLPPQQVTVTRDYRFDPDRVLGAASEEALLREEMQRDLSQLVLRRLAYVGEEPAPASQAQ